MVASTGVPTPRRPDDPSNPDAPASGDPAAGEPERVVRDQGGRPLGRRALVTRARLLEVTEELLARKALREISVADIARSAGTSPASFYQYFKNVEEAALELAEHASEELPAVVGLIDGGWEGKDGKARARELVEAFLRHWDAHRAVLRLRNLASEEGDVRFMDLRRRAMVPVLDALERRIAAAQGERGGDPDVHPRSAAAFLAAALEQLAAYHAELELIGITRQDLVTTAARILGRTVTGRR